MNANIDETVIHCPTCLDLQTAWPKDKTISHKIPGRLWECFRADIFTSNNKHYLCIVDDHSRFSVMKVVGGLLQIIAWVGGLLPSKIVSDANTNFISEKFENFCT